MSSKSMARMLKAALVGSDTPQPETPQKQLAVNIGTVLHACRKNTKLTLDEVSKRSGISLGYLSQIERGKNIPAIETLDTLAKVFGKRASEILQVAEMIEETPQQPGEYQI